MRNKPSRRVRESYNNNIHSKGVAIPSGTYVGFVIATSDDNSMGRVKVNIPKFFGALAKSGTDDDRYRAGIWCRVMSPYGGTQIVDADNNVVSYGHWSQPPAVGTEVMVAFGGDSDKGVVIGVLLAEEKNSTIAGPIGADSDSGNFEPTIALPHSKESSDKPKSHAQAESLKEQGLNKDALRGPSYSNPRRESPSNVFGQSTPSGHAFIMDDGKDDGSSNLIRIRTAGGAQIIMDDENGFTYFINKSGSVWIEMSDKGLDIYARDSLNMHTEGDFNLYAGSNINMEAKNDVFITANGSTGLKLNALAGELNFNCAKDYKLKADGNGNVLIAGGYRETAASIHMNGPGASPASPKAAGGLAGNTTVTSSVASRVPEHEPWKGHNSKKDV